MLNMKEAVFFKLENLIKWYPIIVGRGNWNLKCAEKKEEKDLPYIHSLTIFYSKTEFTCL